MLRKNQIPKFFFRITEIEWLNPKKPVRRLNPHPIFKSENFQSIYEMRFFKSYNFLKKMVFT